jgi:hypothetical protein
MPSLGTPETRLLKLVLQSFGAGILPFRFYSVKESLDKSQTDGDFVYTSNMFW